MNRSVDAQFMLRALELARQGEGLTRPNPPVGAVLVQSGKILAEGFHQKAGGPHAEVCCLEAWSREHGTARLSPEALRASTLYVTLEPCSTQGRTPPCTELILKYGIGRVVVSVRDCNPKHAGRGLDLLRAGGVDVVEGVCEPEGRALLAPFSKFITEGMPYVTLKLAMTADGRIADRTGASKWITGPEARERVQAMRRRADAVMAGAGTVRADDPSLLPRPDEGRRPWRVIIGDRIPPESNVLTDEAADRTLVRSGDLAAILRELAERHDVMHVLCEGGGRLAAGLIEAGLVDEFAFFMAPKLLGSEGIPGIGVLHTALAGAPELAFETVERAGRDLYIRAVPL
jgi:diaminohydroxyphosphoribosylaminopyrimidine deaminase/5-amino-6-(5-phosphoribosylamino)uracil reductase